MAQKVESKEKLKRNAGYKYLEFEVDKLKVTAYNKENLLRKEMRGKEEVVSYENLQKIAGR